MAKSYHHRRDWRGVNTGLNADAEYLEVSGGLVLRLRYGGDDFTLFDLTDDDLLTLARVALEARHLRPVRESAPAHQPVDDADARSFRAAFDGEAALAAS